MIESMTGFGRGSATRGETTARVEIRSVNKRHLSVSVRLPNAPVEVERDVEGRVKDAFERGQFTVSVDLEQPTEDALPLEVDTQAALAYRDLLERLRTAAQIQEPIGLDQLLRFDDVFARTEADASPTFSDDAAQAIADATDRAVDALRAMRREEGDALRTDLLARIDAMENHLDAIEDRAPERVSERQARMQERIADLLDGEGERVDPDRLETEIALLADKLDVTEECVRLRSHLSMFREACADDEPAGRRFKFIVQEIHRETNTIGAKANDEAISRRAVQMKEEIEKIREQIRNVE